MRDPDFIKIDLDLVEGMKLRVERQHRQGESYADMYAENFNDRDFEEDVDQDNLAFQRSMALDVALSISIVDEYMEQQGWTFDYKTAKWIKKAPTVPKLQED